MKGTYFILLGTLVGLVAVFSIHRSLSHTAKTEPTEKVMVARVDIDTGTALTPDLLKEIAWPKAIVPEQAATTPQQLNGRVALVSLNKGEPILLSKLAPEGTAPGLEGLLKKATRAFTVRVDDVSGVSGFIHPKSRVDVLVAIPSGASGGEFLSRVILQDIKVLSAGQTWDQNPGKPVLVNTVTLEVTPEQSEALFLAVAQGKIQLILRNGADKTLIPTTGMVTSQLLHREAPKHEDSDKTIEVIKGTERSAAHL